MMEKGGGALQFNTEKRRVACSGGRKVNVRYVKGSVYMVIN